MRSFCGFFINFASNKCNVFSHYYVVINSCYGSTYNEMKKLIMFAKAALLVMSGAVSFFTSPLASRT